MVGDLRCSRLYLHQSLKSLVSSLLPVTRVGQGSSPEAVEDIALADVVAEVVATNALNAQEKRCRVLVVSTVSACVSGDRALRARPGQCRPKRHRVLRAG